jgi:hemoglobin
VVTDFYGGVLRQSHLKAYFEGVALPHLIQHQVRFISAVLGQTPSAYNGRKMAAAHGSLKITAAHFAEVGAILEAALRKAGMEEADLSTVMSAVAGLQSDVVGT